MRSLSFDLLISPALWLAMALAAAALLAWYGLRRPTDMPRAKWGAIVALMSAGVALPLAILLNPTWLERIPPPPGKPLLTVLVDTSASMSSPDSTGGRSRYAAASQTAKQLASALSKRFELRVRTFAESVAPAEPQGLAAIEPGGERTDLVTALATQLEEQRAPGQAIVLLSDGIHNGGGGSAEVLAAVRLAKAMTTPIYTRTFGGEARQWDVAVELRSPQALAHVGQNVPINVRVRSRGLAGAKANLTLLHDGKEVARREAPLTTQGVEEVSFYVTQSESGLYRYEVRADPLQGEVSLANNSAVYLLHVVDAPIRILLLEGKPYWDAKFLTRTLTSDPAVALDSIVRLAEGRYLRRTLSRSADEQTAPSAPANDAGEAPGATRTLESWKISDAAAKTLEDADTLKSYQIVVLGRDAEHYLSDASLAVLRDWIAEEGGALVCYRGAPTSQTMERLQRLLPVRWSPVAESRFHMTLTERGEDLQWLTSADEPAGNTLLDRLPSLSAAVKIDRVNPLAVVLATSADEPGGGAQPVLAYQPYGSGRVVVIEGAGMWRWAFLPPRYQGPEDVYGALWQSLLRWLVSAARLPAGQEITLRTDKVRFSATETASATLLMRQREGVEVPKVELRAEHLEGPRTFTPVPFGDSSGTFRVLFGKLPEGRYQAVVASAGDAKAPAQTLFEVRSFGEEQLNLQARPDLMARIAEDSGGAVLHSATANELSVHFDEHMRRVRPEQVRRTEAWDRWWVLIGVFTVWSAAWLLRRWSGLV